jgi:hypothetical protein
LGVDELCMQSAIFVMGRTRGNGIEPASNRS